MRKEYLVLLICVFCSSVQAQKISLDSLVVKGIEAYNHGELNKAIKIFEECVPIARHENREDALLIVYNNIANSYTRKGDVVNALEYYHKAKKIAEQRNDRYFIAKTTKNIGTIYSEQKDFKGAIEYYTRAEELATGLEDKTLEADILNNLGIVYEQQNEYDKALDVYNRSLAIYSATGDEGKISMSLNNLGIVHKYLGNYSQSILNYQKALDLSRKLDDRFMIAANLNNMGNVYVLQGDFNRSLRLCLEALKQAREIEAVEVIIEALDGVAVAYEKLKNFKDALKYRKLYEEARFDYINAARSRQIAELEIKYETARKEKEIGELKQHTLVNELAIQEQKLQIQNRNYMIAAGVFAMLLILGGSYYYNKNQMVKANLSMQLAVKEREQAERSRIAKDIHDDLGSGLSKINFLSRIISEKTAGQPELTSHISTIAATARGLVENMYSLIWAMNTESSTLANLIANVREYSADFLEDYPLQLKSVFPDLIPEMAIKKEVHHAVFMVVKESLNNIVKHAEATEVGIEAEVEDRLLKIRVRDNGMGFKSSGKGNGLRNMVSRIEAIGGTLDIQSASGEGTKISIELSVSALSA